MSRGARDWKKDDGYVSWQNDTDAYRRYHEREAGLEKHRQDVERYGDPFRTTLRHPPVSGPFSTVADRRTWRRQEGEWWKGTVVSDPWSLGQVMWFDTEEVTDGEL